MTTNHPRLLTLLQGRSSDRRVNLSAGGKRNDAHRKELLQDISDLLRFRMDGLGDGRAVRDIAIPGSGALEHEESTEGCTVHEGKGLRVTVQN
jgi:hypothetical protein